MRRRPRSAREAARAAALACALGIVAAPAGVAVAAPPDGAIEVSDDGATWSDALTTDLFGTIALWVPGDAETGTLLVRSRACATATAEAEIIVPSGDAVLAEGFSFRTRVDDGPWAAGTVSAPFVVGTDPVSLQVEATFDPAAGSETQARTVHPVVKVTAACDGPAAPTGSAAPAPAAAPLPTTLRPGALPTTGVEAVRTLAAAGLLVVAGSWLLLAVRRRRAADA